MPELPCGGAAERCRREKRCRLAYRDGGNMRLGDEGVAKRAMLRAFARKFGDYADAEADKDAARAGEVEAEDGEGDGDSDSAQHQIVHPTVIRNNVVSILKVGM